MKGMQSVLQRRMLSVADMAVIMLCLSAAVIPFIRHAPPGASLRIVVYRDDVPVAEVDADRDTLFTVTGACGSTRVQVSDGRARIAASCCPHSVCMEQGWISRPGSWVLCLPNRIMVKVAGTGTEGGIDALSR